MNFASIDFILFYITVLCGWYILKNRGTIYTVFMLMASYYFYMSWNPKFILLIIFSTVIDYFLGQQIYKAKTKQKRKKLLRLSLVTNLGLLGIFKYTNFILGSISTLLLANGIIDEPLEGYNITLPVGISFYTFQTLSYSIDIYRGTLKPERNFLRFALFVAFFPQLVAGPIVRAKEMLPQLSKKLKWETERFSDGCWLISIGLFKKLYLSNNFGPFSDNVFSNPTIWSSFEMWMGVIAYSMQIYCDFSGYSDIAIGIARIMGYDFKRNFNMPYSATSITDFWRRWHISLSSCLRDYIYIPLGGSRNGSLVMILAIMGTMTLGGLWHGASWTFVIWGILHGIYLLIHKLWCHIKYLMEWQSIDSSLSWKIFSGLLTFLAVMVAFIFFRAQNLTTALTIIKGLFQPLHLPDTVYTPYFFMLLIIILAHVFSSFYTKKWAENTLISHKYILILLMLLSAFALAPRYGTPFIYFQF